MKREGTMFYNAALNRFDIAYGISDYHGGLHCGECFDVLMCGKWIPTRIEYDHEKKLWYLIGLKISGMELKDLHVRIL
jgi:hypothetical protein